MKPSEINILVGCEESQAVCKAFRARGFNAFSCDIFPCSGGHPEWHIQGDVFQAIESKEWHAGVFFPPCTHLCVSGAKHFPAKIADGRQQAAINFFMSLVNLNCKNIAIENPVGIMSSKFRKPNQIIQPYQFGDEAKKTTCLWLKGFPELKYTNIVNDGIFYISPSGKKMASWSHDPIDENGKKISYNSEAIKRLRSKTFPGIAEAMAHQWGDYLLTQHQTL